MATYHTLLHLWRLPVKHIGWFYAILNYTYRSVEEAHEVTGRLSCVVREHLAVLLANGNEELVYRHGGVNSNFSTKEGFDFMFFYGGRGMF